jgi:hypothetical protein
MLRQPVKDAILVPHDIDSFRIQIVAKRLGRRKINVMRQAGQPWIKPGQDNKVKRLRFDFLTR